MATEQKEHPLADRWREIASDMGISFAVVDLSNSSVLQRSYQVFEIEDENVELQNEFRIFVLREKEKSRQVGFTPNVPAKQFTLDHLKSIKKNETWTDWGKNMPFTGRSEFVTEVANHLEEYIRASPPTTPEKPAPASPGKQKVSKALVYSSVSGSGKTVSMLQLKNELRNRGSNNKVFVAYLGFNTGLALDAEETNHMQNRNELGAREVLARRLTAATIISMQNEDAITELPQYSHVYEGYEIPNIQTSLRLLKEYTGASRVSPIYIIAGVDEVQLLNNSRTGFGEAPLGRMFLRFLRQWQCEWANYGIHVLPLGTGIAVDWSADPTTGFNVPLDSDTEDSATLIKKEDFQMLVQKVVDGVRIEDRYAAGTQKETLVDLISAAYWPRVRLLEFWRDDNLKDIQRGEDSNSKQWVTWLCNWMCNEPFAVVAEAEYAPGKGDTEGKIFALFRMEKRMNAHCFYVIPDGYTSHTLVYYLKQDLPVPSLYDNLDVINGLNLEKLILMNAIEFEQLGFHVVGTAIHVGIRALQGTTKITSDSASALQKNRLGLALWLKGKDAVTENKEGKLLIPKILGRMNGLVSNIDDFYPFNDCHQASFNDEVLRELELAVEKHHPVYIRCGRQTCCDYLYFYLTMTEHSGARFICYICDAKHTNKDIEEGESSENISAAEQKGLFEALVKVDSAMRISNLALGSVRLLFVTNRDGLATPRANSNVASALKLARENAQTLKLGVEVELLHKKNFEFGPFSDILQARRKGGTKRDRLTELDQNKKVGPIRGYRV